MRGGIMAYLSALSSGFFIYLIIKLIAAVVGRQRRLVLTRLDWLNAQRPADLEQELEAPFTQRVILPGLLKAGMMLSRLTPRGFSQQLRRKLVLAGSPGRLGTSEFIGLQGLSGCAVSALAVLLAGILDGQLMLWGLWGFIVGVLLPQLYLIRLIKKRQKEVQHSLPDVLDLLTISVEAGLGFDAALGRVVEKLGGVLGRECSRVLQEIKMGKPRREALRDMANRLEVEDLSTFINAVIQAEQLGVGIASVLRLQSHAMRVKRRQRAEEAAMQAPVKMLIPLIFFIFPGLFVVLLGPAVIQIMETLLGM
jgi:tight adherence protein C